MGSLQELKSLTTADRAARVGLAAAFRHFNALKRMLECEQPDFAR